MSGLVLILWLQEAPPKPELAWLLRHQAKDGSFGSRPEHCRCPLDPRPESEKADPEKVRELLALLSSDDIDDRAFASEALERFGKSVRPLLRESSESTSDSEVKARIAGVVDRLEFVDRDEFEITVLALQAFEPFGYDPAFAPARERTYRWLKGRQQEDGLVGPIPTKGVRMANVEAAMALWVAWRVHGWEEFKAPAERAWKAILREQRTSGAWGPGVDDPGTTLSAVVWLGLCDPEREECKKGIEYLREQAAHNGRFERVLWAVAEQEAGTGASSDVVRELAALGPEPMKGVERPFASRVMFDSNRASVGERQEQWQRWLKSLKPLLRVAETGDG